jgi:hypothetical protein
MNRLGNEPRTEGRMVNVGDRIYGGREFEARSRRHQYMLGGPGTPR